MKNIFVFTATVILILASLLTFTPGSTHAQSKNGLCLTEPEFTNVHAMGQTDEQRLQTIRDWLDGLLPRSPKGGFLKGRNPDGTDYTFQDLDGIPTDPAKEISNTAGGNKINPRVLLTTLRKEQPKVFKDSDPPTERTLRTLAGCGSSPTAREQIQCMGRKLKEWFYDQTSQCKATPGGWNVDLTKQTGDTPGQEKDASGNTCSVEPESKAVTALYQYTPWIGRTLEPPPKCGYGHPDYPDGVGGNGLFCYFWKQHGWKAPPGALALSPQPVTMSCAPPTLTQPSRCLSINASGGDTSTGSYTWTNTKGVIAITGVNQQNIQLKPPETVDLGQDAYWITGFRCADTQSCDNIIDGGGAAYSCTDNFLHGVPFVNVPGNSPIVCCGATAVGIFCSQCTSLPTCIGDGNPGGHLQVHPEAGLITVMRTEQMKTQGCLPCRLEMQGATVTVMDAAGTPVTTTVTVK